MIAGSTLSLRLASVADGTSSTAMQPSATMIIRLIALSSCA
jgi:hypothetical protein